MILKITKSAILLIAIFFTTTYVNAQSGDFEFLFEGTANDGTELEGFSNFGSGGSTAVANGNLTFTFGLNTSGFELNPPASTINIEKANFPYLAIKLSAIPAARQYMYCKTNAGSWYKNKVNPILDSGLEAVNVVYWNMSGDDFKTTPLPDGAIARLIFNLEPTDKTATPSVDVAWIKSFASVQAIADYAGVTLGVNDVVNQSKVKIISGDNKISVKYCEPNTLVEIFDLLGRNLHSSTVNNNTSVNIKTAGICIVKLTNTDGSVITKKTLVY
jgi:hypothetical protein